MNPILLSSDRRSRKRKSISWQPDEKIRKIHYFEYIADERVNVNRINEQNKIDLSTSSAIGGSSPNANKAPVASSTMISNASVDPIRRSYKSTDSDGNIEYLPWRPLVPIDFTPELPSPGWNSKERTAQAERETYVLGAIDLPGQPSTLDEPDQQSKPGPSNGLNTSAVVAASTATNSDLHGNEAVQDVKIIPTENPEGMYTEYQNMYNMDQVIPEVTNQAPIGYMPQFQMPTDPQFMPQQQFMQNPLQPQHPNPQLLFLLSLGPHARSHTHFDNPPPLQYK